MLLRYELCSKTYIWLCSLQQQEEARLAQEEANARAVQAREREEEAERLQFELDEARKKMEETQRELETALTAPPAVHVDEGNDDRMEYGAYNNSYFIIIRNRYIFCIHTKSSVAYSKCLLTVNSI